MHGRDVVKFLTGRMQGFFQVGWKCTFCALLISFNKLTWLKLFFFVKPWQKLCQFATKLMQFWLPYGTSFSGRLISTCCWKLTGANAPIEPVLTTTLHGNSCFLRRKFPIVEIAWHAKKTSFLSFSQWWHVLYSL